ncbi:MAG: PQQ-binding-like beta-propeller repeat protein [Lentisphaeria bacterium]|nr:PQQ-binding-like beta-propeller repeat protein [Lentisphaeria bacterium]
MKPSKADTRARQCLTGLAWGCFFFAASLTAMLVTTHVQLRRADPLESSLLQDLRADFAEKGGEETAERIRQLDWLARRAFFTSRRQLRTGSALLVMSVLLGAGCWTAAGSLDRPDVAMPTAKNAPDHRWRANRTARGLLVGAGAAAALCLGMWAAYSTLPEWMTPAAAGKASGGLSGSPPGAPGTVMSTPPGPAVDQDQAWPAFRGWGGLGRAAVAGIPLTWDGGTDVNLLWKIALDLPGFSSPVVWEKRVFLSSGNAERRVVTCHSLETGEILWEHAVTDIDLSPEKPPEVTDDTGYAAPTPAVSADGVCAIFANGDLVCLTLEGDRRWAQNVGVPENHYGHSSSLLIDAGVLFVQYDHNAAASLMAYDVKTGELLWRVARDTISWGSPVMITAPDGKHHVVLVNESTVRGYSPGDGGLLWEEKCLGGEVAPSAAYEGGIVFVANEYAQAAGVRVDSGGASEILWTWDEALPDVASPVAANGKVWLATSAGEVICLQGKTGRVVYRKEFDHGFYASPIVNGDRIYLTDLTGETIVFGTGDTFETLGGGRLGEAAFATPALVRNRLIIRGAKHLFCFGKQ